MPLPPCPRCWNTTVSPILTETYLPYSQVTEVQISGFKEGCRDLRGRQMLNNGGVTSASCSLHNRILRRPVTCFETPMQFVTPHHHVTSKTDHSASPSQAICSPQLSPRTNGVKAYVLPVVKSATGQSFPSSGRPLAAQKRQSDTKPVTLSQLHKLITHRSSLDEVIEDKPHVRISIKRTELGQNGQVSSARPKVKVMILNKQDSQVPMLPKTICNEVEDSEQRDLSNCSEENFLYEEWKFIPNFSQKDLLSQLDSKALRSLERTRAWLLSIPLDGADDEAESISSTSVITENDK